MIVFRTDASQKIGFGHLNRTTYLASLLKSKCEVLFCINKDKAVTRFLDEKNCSYCTLKELERRKPHEYRTIIFDLRNFGDDDLRLLQHAKANNHNTVQITDLGLSQQAIDYTIDSSIFQLFPYPPEKEKALLLGPQYAILHTHYRHFFKVKRKYRQKIKNVFISFGGGTNYRHLRKVVDTLYRQRYEIKIAPGFCLKKNSPKTLRRIYPGIRFLGKAESLARSFFEADVALITSGVAAYEAAAVGTPALYVYYHDEQKFTAQSFEKMGAGLEICNIDDIIKVDWVEKMNMLPFEKRLDMGNKGKTLVDGRGIYRIIDFLEAQGLT